MKKLFLTLSLVALVFTSYAEDTDQGIKFFKGTFEEALAKAKAENKLLFVDYWTTW